MAKREPNGVLHIHESKIAPGKGKRIEIPVADLPNHVSITMPVHIINGGRDGPQLFLCAAIHGDEINGAEIVRRVMKLLDAESIRGVLLAVPIVNVFGFLTRSRYLPDRRDLNREFPGSSKGSLARRIAKAGRQ